MIIDQEGEELPEKEIMFEDLNEGQKTCFTEVVSCVEKRKIQNKKEESASVFIMQAAAGTNKNIVLNFFENG